MVLAVNRPKESRAALEPITNTFAVQNGMFYDYYSIKFGQRKGDFVEVLKLPPIISAGYITFNKKLYELTIRDYFRRRLNVGKPSYTTTATSSGNAADSSNSGPVPATMETTTNAGDQSAAIRSDELQINQAADLAWKEQIESLLALDDPEAEWVLPLPAQS